MVMFGDARNTLNRALSELQRSWVKTVALKQKVITSNNCGDHYSWGFVKELRVEV